jgi:hypothetical protein
LRHFQKRAAKILIFFSALLFHIIINNWHIGTFFPAFSLFSFINSTLVFYLLNYLLKSYLAREYE